MNDQIAFDWSSAPCTYVIAVECIKHSWNVTAYDSDGDPSVVKCHPSAAVFFGPVAAE